MKRIYEFRKKRGLTQAALALRSGISQTAISNYEVGDREPGSTAIIALARAMGCSADYLLGLTDDPTPRSMPADLSEQEQAIIAALRAGDYKKAVRLVMGD
jgi:transcriptional regulator with XRE-family HTH domain